MAEFPLIVKIGHYRWRVEMVEAFEDENDWGECDHKTLTIRVSNKLPEPHKTTALVHEIFHAMLAHSGLNEHDEFHVNALSIRLVEVLRDNPELVKAIVDE